MIDQYSTLAEKFLRKGFWLYLFSFIIAPIGYFIKIIVSNELSVSEVGILYGIISLITLLTAYSDLGTTESLKYFIPKFFTEKKYNQIKSILFITIITQLCISAILTIAIYFGAGFLANYYFRDSSVIESLQIFSLFFIGISIFGSLNNFFLSVQDTFYHKITEFLRTLLVLLSIIFIFFADLSSLENFSYAWIVGLYLGIVCSLGVFYFKYYRKYFVKEKIVLDREVLKSFFKYSFISLIGISGTTILSQIDMQMIILMLDTTSAGYYTNYLSIITIPFTLIGPIFWLLLPVFSELHSKGEFEKIRLIRSIFFKIFISVGLMFNIFFFIFATNISYTFFGERFITSGNILQYSILFLIFNFLLKINFYLLGGIGKIHERVKITFIAIAINVILNIIFIQLIGVYGAALATGIGWITMFLLSERVIEKKYKSHIDFTIIYKNILYLGCLGGVMFLMQNQIETISRLQNLYYLLVLFIVWFLFFAGVNYKDFKIFFGEIQKLRKTKYASTR